MRLGRGTVLLTVLWLSWLWNHGTRLGIASVAPFLMKTRNISGAEAGLLVSVHNLAFYSSMFALAQSLSATRPSTAIFLSMVLGGAALLAAQPANDLTWLLVVLLVSGSALGLYIPSAVRTLASTFPPNKHGRVMAVHESAAPIGQTVGPVMVSVIALALSPELTIASLGLIGIALALTYYLTSHRREQVGAERRPEEGPASHVSRAALLVAALLTTGVLVGNLGIANVVPIYLVDDKGLEPAYVAQLLGVSRVSGSLMQLVAGASADKWGKERLLWVVITTNALATLGIAYLPFSDLYIILLFVQAGITAAFFPVYFAYAAEVASPAGASALVSKSLGVAGIVGPTLTPMLVTRIAEAYSYPTAFLYPVTLSITSIPALVLLTRLVKSQKT